MTTEPQNNFEKAFLIENAQVVFVHKGLREAFLDWVHERGCELFQIPIVVDDDGKLTLDDPDDDLPSFALTPNDALAKPHGTI